MQSSSLSVQDAIPRGAIPGAFRNDNWWLKVQWPSPNGHNKPKKCHVRNVSGYACISAGTTFSLSDFYLVVKDKALWTHLQMASPLGPPMSTGWPQLSDLADGL